MQTNNDIYDESIRLLDEEGQQIGVVPLAEAKARAERAGLDLVKISPTAIPPVCKIMDYGKFKFNEAKKVKEQRRNQKIVELKEIQLSMRIDEHDIVIKAKRATAFLQEGNKVKVVLKMRGREQAFSAKAIENAIAFCARLAAYGTPEKAPEHAGRNVIIVLAPNKK